MAYRYIPMLRWKRGEKRGIKAVSEAFARNVYPLIALTEDTFADQPETARSEAMPASYVFADDVYKHWGARPFYLDATRIPGNGVHPLIDTANQCREMHANLIPATRLGASESYEAAVMNVALADGVGVALIVNLREFTSADQWVPSWPHAPNKTDLILDLGDRVATVADLGSTLDLAFRNLHRASEWRTVTVAGTSMPENFGEFDTDGVYLIERHEVTLWQHLISLSLPYRLDYSDYATVAITGAPTEVRTGFPINIRYTLPTQFLICRGVRTRGEGSRDQAPQLISHAKTIVRYRNRNRLNCWADDTIDKIAAEEEKPGSLETWVTLGVNRHIARVRMDVP